MMKLLAIAFVLAAGCSAAHPEPVSVHPLFADEPWYRAKTQPERTFEGTLIENPAPREKHYFRPSNRYLLKGAETWEVYTPSRDEVLAPFLGTRVRLIGKLVETDIEGVQRREIWPARLEVLSPAAVRDAATAGVPTPRSRAAGTTPAMRRGS
jgi:hypothetical protein